MGLTLRFMRRSKAVRESMPDGDYRDWKDIGASGGQHRGRTHRTKDLRHEHRTRIVQGRIQHPRQRGVASRYSLPHTLLPPCRDEEISRTQAQAED